jgi:hypothetical protein
LSDFFVKKYWQRRLKTLVEAWSNTKLELTSIYGLRQYNEGARLISHVDRTLTHAASLIINVAQGNVAQPWHLHIHDHANRLHEIEMDEGDIVFYESAKCLHGRMAPLTGKNSYFVNLFAHYRPDGEGDEWSTNPVPEGQPDKILSLEGVDVETVMPYLASTRETAHSSHDLLDLWQRSAPKANAAQVMSSDDEL